MQILPKNYISISSLLTLTIVIALTSCGGEADTADSGNNFEQPQPFTENSFADDFDDKNKVYGYSSYPFGYATLVTFSFSNQWNIVDKSGTLDMGHSVYHKALLDINKCLSDLNHDGKTIPTPPFKKLEHVKIDTDVITCNDFLRTDSIIYSLDPIGPYKAYYVFGNFQNDRDESVPFTQNDCAEFGNLLLIDSVTNNAKIINLYMAKGDESKVDLRLFYIDKNQNIHIKELQCDQMNCAFTKIFVLQLENKGKINIQKL